MSLSHRIPGPLIAVVSNFLMGLDANQATYPLSNPAEATSRNEHPVISFDDTTAENVIFHVVMISDYKDNDIIFQIDWVATSATTGNVVWGVEIERIAPDGHDLDSDSFAAQQTGTSTTNGTSGVVTRTSIALTQAQADSIESSDSFRIRIQRLAADASDTMVGDAQLLRVGIIQ